MKSPQIPLPFHLSTVVLLLASLGSCLSIASARIGETREVFEQRLFAAGGIAYREPATLENRMSGMPYNAFLELMGRNADIRVYFKTSDGSRAGASLLEERRMLPGWDIHVVYFNGRSAIEIYKRSQAINEYEFNNLLALHSGGSFWKRVERGSETPSALGYQMERDDGKARARRIGGDAVLIFDPVVDTKLAELKAAELLEEAPISVEGF